MKAFARYASGALIPASSMDKQAFEGLSPNTVYDLDIKQKRNSRFHRKVLGLLQLAFDYWQPIMDIIEVNGVYVRPEKNFDVFRKEVTKAAGFYEVVWLPDGSFKIEAKSISYAKMDEIEFKEVYERYLDVLVADTLSLFSDAEREQAVDRLIGFL